MTNPTPHGQVPEALPAIQRFEVVDCIDSKHVPAVIPKPHGPWVRYEDHIAALAAGQATTAQPGAAYAALPDEGEPWRGHKFKEVQRGCWRCDCGKTIKEATSDQSTPASGGNYPVMPKRYTVDDDGEELFTAEKMRAFADATCAMRVESLAAAYCEELDKLGQRNYELRLASHGQAPAQAAPAAMAGPDDYTPLLDDEGRMMVGTSHHYTAENIRALVAEYKALEAGGPDTWELHYNTDHRARAGVLWRVISALADEVPFAAAPTTQPAPQQEARPVTPYTCPKCHALWLHWPAEQSGFGMDTLNCRSTTHCDYCEKGGVEQLERLERVPAALKAPQQEAQEPVGYTHASWIAEAKRGGGGSFVGRKNAAFDVPIYTAPPHSPAAQGDALDAAFEAVRKRLCKLPRYSFALDSRSNLRRCEDKSGNWIEFDSVHALFDPVAIDAARAAQEGKSHDR